MKVINKAKAFVSYKIKTFLDKKEAQYKAEIKSFVSAKIAEKESKYKAEFKLIKEQVFFNYVLPQITLYVRDMIIAKGLNPDAVPQPKVEVISREFSTRGLPFKFDTGMPKWVSKSFTDPTKHPLYSGKVKLTPVVEAPVEELQVTLPVMPIDGLTEENKKISKAFEALYSFTDPNYVDSTNPNYVDSAMVDMKLDNAQLDLAENRAKARAKIISDVSKELKVKAKRKSPVKKDKIK
jgi:hypothetical protein